MSIDGPRVRQRAVSTPTQPTQQRQGTVSVRRAIYENRELASETEYTQTVDVPFYEDVSLGSVAVEGGITRNMGDFNSVRVSVNLTLPCLPEMSEVERAYDTATRFVSGKVQEELDIAIRERSPDGPGPQPQQEQSQGIERQESAGIRRQLQT